MSTLTKGVMALMKTMCNTVCVCNFFLHMRSKFIGTNKSDLETLSRVDLYNSADFPGLEIK